MVRVRVGAYDLEDPEDLAFDAEAEWVEVHVNGSELQRVEAGEVVLRVGPRPESDRVIETGDEAESAEGSG